MNENHIFIKYINKNENNVIDKEIEEDFPLEEILINDKGTSKILFIGPDNYEIKNEQQI